MEFSLFRIKVVRQTQTDVFSSELAPPQILRKAIQQRPSDQGERVRWSVANVQQVDSNALYFALGRASSVLTPVQDERTGDFIERAFESAPYTHVLVDIALEVVAIAPQYSLASDVASLARRLVGLLNLTPVASEERATFEISAINRPDEFIRQLREAYAIKSFTIYFTRPNPIDVEEDFHKPMERLAELANGTHGSATLKGSSLDAQPLSELARSAAASGDDATARIVTEPNTNPVKRTLRGNTAKITHDGVDSPEARRSILERLRDAYAAIRSPAL